MKILFNFYEIKNIGKNYDGMVLLTYCLTKPYGSFLGKHLGILHKKLNINNIPRNLFSSGYLKVTKNGIYNFYKTQSPQSYFTNDEFLYYKVPAKIKSDYLYILGQRRIDSNDLSFPSFFVSEEFGRNPLILNAMGQITLTLEKK